VWDDTPNGGKKKGGIKVHSSIHANEQVLCDIQFTSAATHDSFMLQPERFSSGDILAFDRAYMDYEKFEELSQRGAIYVTKMKKSLRYSLLSDTMVQAPEGLMELRLQEVIFNKTQPDGTVLQHKARLITYPEDKKRKRTTLLTNDLDTEPYDLIQVYRTRWKIEFLFNQLKQNFLLCYFYGESANAIKIQIWVTLLANLLLMVLKARLKRTWSFFGLATIVRICLMYYVDVYTLLEHPERDWARSQGQRGDPRYECLLFE
jgi:transposase DDE domain